MNKKLEALRQKAQAIAGGIRALLDKAIEEGRGLTAEEKAKRDADQAQLNGIRELIQAEVDLETHERWSAEPTRRSEAPDPGDDEEEDEEEEDDDERAPGTRTRRVTSMVDREAKKPFRSLGEQLMAVARAYGPDHHVDKRLLRVNEEQRAASGLNEATPSDGGFLVQKDFIATLVDRTTQVGQILRRVSRLPVGANSNGAKIPAVDESSRADGSRKGGIRAYWVAEAAEKTASKPKFRLMELDLKKLAALVYATDELLQDSALLEAWIQRNLPDELRFKAEDAIINGDGAGKPLGILQSPALVTVAIESGQTIANSATHIATNAAKMLSRFYVPSLQNAAWLINQSHLANLIVMTVGGSGGATPVYLPGGSLSGQPLGTLLGLPVIPMEYAAAVGTVGDFMLVDLSEYVMIEKGGIQAASSIHVRFVYDETAFRFVWRIDGQPTWQSALTPYKGSDTVSPFVALAARS
jgi:HK97 family phage major capsid protein